MGTVGGYLQVTADGAPLAKVAGVTLDWATFAAVSGTDVTLNDGQVIKVGEKFARYGQVIAQITASGKYGPHDPAASDGRQTLAKGKAYVLNRTALQSEPMDEYPEAIEGGRVFRARLLQVGTGTASLAAGPTMATIETTFPNFTYVD